MTRVAHALGTVGSVPRRNALELGAYVALPLSAAVFGVIIALQPEAAVALAAAAGLVALGLAAPVANLTLLLFLVAIVPYGLQNRYGFGGGQGAPGLLVADLVLLVGVARAGYELVMRPPDDTRSRALCLAAIALLALIAAQALRGVLAGRGVSEVGAEFRVFLVMAAVVVIVVSVVRRDQGRRRLARGLALLGVALGLWAVIQWTVNIPFTEAGDAGVREGIRLTTGGRGQIQGGLFSFPVAVITAAAVLSSGVPSRPVRLLLISVFVLNLAGLLLTYERTFWVAGLVGLGYVVLRSSRTQRLRTLFWGSVTVLVFFAAVSTVAPDVLSPARERLLSLGDYASDSSVRYRVTEAEHVATEIAESPLFGSGLAATIYWGRPWEGIPPEEQTFAHNGYLWLIWKLGAVVAALLLAALAAAAIKPSPRGDDALAHGLRLGAKASLAALLLASVTFPSFTQLSSSGVVGLLVALALVPLQPPASR